MSAQIVQISPQQQGARHHDTRSQGTRFEHLRRTIRRSVAHAASQSQANARTGSRGARNEIRNYNLRLGIRKNSAESFAISQNRVCTQNNSEKSTSKKLRNSPNILEKFSMTPLTFRESLNIITFVMSTKRLLKFIPPAPVDVTINQRGGIFLTRKFRTYKTVQIRTCTIHPAPPKSRTWDNGH